MSDGPVGQHEKNNHDSGNNFGNEVTKELAWKVALIAAGALHPAGSLVVYIAYQASKAGSAAEGVNSGHGFDIKVGVLETGIEGLSFGFRIRLFESEPGRSPSVRFYLDFSLLDPLGQGALDLDGPSGGRDEATPGHILAGQWWFEYLGDSTLIDHGLVLDEIRSMSVTEALAALNEVGRKGPTISRREPTASGLEPTAPEEPVVKPSFSEPPERVRKPGYPTAAELQNEPEDTLTQDASHDFEPDIFALDPDIDPDSGFEVWH